MLILYTSSHFEQRNAQRMFEPLENEARSIRVHVRLRLIISDTFEPKPSLSFLQINNAGVLYKENESLEDITTTLQTNYYGVKYVTKAMLPVLRQSPAGARVIIVSSKLGQLNVCYLSYPSVYHEILLPNQ